MKSLESPEDRVAVERVRISFLDSLIGRSIIPDVNGGRGPFWFGSRLSDALGLRVVIGGLVGGAVLPIAWLGELPPKTASWLEER